MTTLARFGHQAPPSPPSAKRGRVFASSRPRITSVRSAASSALILRGRIWLLNKVQERIYALYDAKDDLSFRIRLGMQQAGVAKLEMEKLVAKIEADHSPKMRRCRVIYQGGVVRVLEPGTATRLTVKARR